LYLYVPTGSTLLDEHRMKSDFRVVPGWLGHNYQLSVWRYVVIESEWVAEVDEEEVEVRFGH